VAKKRKKNKSSRRTLSSLSLKDRKRKKSSQNRQNWVTLFKVLSLVALVSAAAIGIAFLNKYVTDKSALENKTTNIKLVGAPAWINQPLQEKIYSAAQIGQDDLEINEALAASVQQNIANYVAWFDDVKVQATHDSLLIKARWRKPLALIEIQRRRFYVDANSVVLDFVELDTLPLVRITGLSSERVPAAGNVWGKEDLAAAVDIIHRLDEMDRLVSPDNPLLFELESIDVSNFNGRYSRKNPHILMFAKDGTKIIFGAEIGNWAEHLEVPDAEKIGRLYNFYNQHGTLQNTARYINLCDPQQYVPQPADEY